MPPLKAMVHILQIWRRIGDLFPREEAEKKEALNVAFMALHDLVWPKSSTREANTP
jgi:hypothetical protein